MEKDRRQGQSGRSRFDGNARPRVERSAGTPGSAGAVAEPAAVNRNARDAAQSAVRTSAPSPSSRLIAGPSLTQPFRLRTADRQSVVEGKRVRVRVELGGGGKS